MTVANVVDMYHGNNHEAVPDMVSLRHYGIFAVVHKASQGTAFVDKLYAVRRKAALDAGVLWGAYHFMTSENPIEQAKRFLDAAKPDDNTLLACDFEKSQATPALHQAIDFMSYVDQNSPGTISCVLYSGDLIREALTKPRGGHVADAMRGADMFFAQHRLWLAEYGPHANVPWPWSDKSISQMWQQPFLWQFSEKGHVPPIVGTSDLNYYPGNFETLKANWPTLMAATPNPAATS